MKNMYEIKFQCSRNSHQLYIHIVTKLTDDFYWDCFNMKKIINCCWKNEIN